MKIKRIIEQGHNVHKISHCKRYTNGKEAREDRRKRERKNSLLTKKDDIIQNESYIVQCTIILHKLVLFLSDKLTCEGGDRLTMGLP